MAWFFKKEKGNLIVLEQREEQLTKQELHLIEEAIKECAFFWHFTDAAQRQEAIEHLLKEGPKTLKQLKDIITRLKPYSAQIKKLSTRIERDLIGTRAERELFGPKSRIKGIKFEELGRDELGVLRFTQQIDANIEKILGVIGYMSSILSENKGIGERWRVYTPDSPYQTINTSARSLYNELVALKAQLLHLYQLEKKVEELTAIAAA